MPRATSTTAPRSAGRKTDGGRPRGGWYDAGEYLKFSLTVAYASFMQLFALHELAPLDLAPLLRNAIRNEARIGLEYYSRHTRRQRFYFQVADERDHDQPFRLPEDDTAYGGPRPAYTASAPIRPAKRPPRSRSAARVGERRSDVRRALPGRRPGDLRVGQEHRRRHLDRSEARTAGELCAQSERVRERNLDCDFYNEDSWLDDMTIGAIELYEATGTAQYLTDAVGFAQTLEAAYASLGLLNLHDEAFYKVYPHLPVSGSFTQANALAQLQIDADRIRKQVGKNPYNVGQRSFLWGSAADIAGDAVTCLLFSKLTGDPGCQQAARWQLDFLFGRNPFGVSLLAGAGALYPLHPHHQVAFLLASNWYASGNIIGSLAGGLAKKSQYPFRSDPDLTAVLGDSVSIFQPFENNRFLYHDIHEDYVSNEPALDSNSNLLAALLGFAQ